MGIMEYRVTSLVQHTKDNVTFSRKKKRRSENHSLFSSSNNTSATEYTLGEIAVQRYFIIINVLLVIQHLLK